MGMSRPVHILLPNAEVENIVAVAAIAVVDAQENDTCVHSQRADAVTVTVER
jgi:hypothetical protein